MWRLEPNPSAGEEPRAGLTMEEALSLLDLLLLSPVELTEHQQSALQKLSLFCRHGLMAS